MSLRARVGIRYPVGASLTLALKAGGVSKLSPEERSTLHWKIVEAGGRCNDLPDCSRAALLTSGKVYDDGEAMPVKQSVKKTEGAS